MKDVFVVWSTNERHSALFQVMIIVRDPHHNHKSPTHHEQDLNLRKT